VIGPDVRVAHVGIAVADLHEALGFYQDILGVEPAPETTADGAAIVSTDPLPSSSRIVDPASTTSRWKYRISSTH